MTTGRRTSRTSSGAGGCRQEGVRAAIRCAAPGEAGSGCAANSPGRKNVEGEDLLDQTIFPDLVAELGPVASIIVNKDADGVPRRKEIDHVHAAELLAVEKHVIPEGRLPAAPFSVTVVLPVKHGRGEHHVIAEQREKGLVVAGVKSRDDLVKTPVSLVRTVHFPGHAAS
jgi:hypothetical protein